MDLWIAKRDAYFAAAYLDAFGSATDGSIICRYLYLRCPCFEVFLLIGFYFWASGAEPS